MDKLVGTKQEADALQGRGVLQSEEEWEARNWRHEPVAVNVFEGRGHLAVFLIDTTRRIGEP
jgi:hypothetical protein